MFKKWFAFLMVFGVLVGCSGLQIGDDLATEMLARNGARGLGYAVARLDNENLTVAVEQAYLLLRQGQFDESKMTALIQQFKTAGEKLIAYAILDLLKVMGAQINSAQQTILDLSGIPDWLWDVAEDAYLQGYDMGAMDKKSGVTRVLP